MPIKLLILSLVFGFAGYAIAKNRGRNPLVWFILSAAIPPLIIAILLLPQMVAKGYTKKCAHCSEIIKEEATMCKHCGMGQ